jgi:phage virion morphogenesis protein
MQLVISHDFAPLQAHLQALYARLNHDLTPLMENIGMALESSTRARFETETAPDGTPWQPLKDSTTFAKSTAGRGGQVRMRGGILSDRGDLRKSITYFATSQSVAIGTDRHYGVYHQLGTDPYTIEPRAAKALSFLMPGGRVAVKHVHHPGLPARPFLGVSAADEVTITEFIRQYVAGEL